MRLSRRLALVAALGLLAATACSSGGSSSPPDAILTAVWDGKQLTVVRLEPDDHGPVTPAPGIGQPALDWELVDATGKVLASGSVKDPSFVTAEFGTDKTPAPFTTQGAGLIEIRIPNLVGTLTVHATTGSSGVTGKADPSLHLQGICASSSANCASASTAVPKSATASRNYNVKKLLDHGACAPVNILLVSEGYQASEMGTFESVVMGVVSGLPSFSGYSEHMSDINIWVLELQSQTSGITDPGCANSHPANMDDCTQYHPTPTKVARNTAFGASFGDNINVPRRAVTIGGGAMGTTQLQALAAVAQAKRQVRADVTGYIFNDPGNAASGYGGAADIQGQSFTTSSFSNANNSVVSVAAHETGHALFGLQDEYDYGDSAATCAAEAAGQGDQGRGPFPLVNVTSNQASPPWSTAGDGGTPVAMGTVQGGYYCTAGFYRNQDTCLMKELDAQFCTVCKAHVDAIFAQREAYAKCACGTDAGAGAVAEAGVTCTVKTTGISGVCLDTGVCAAMTGYVSTPNYCPGKTNIQCCTQAPTDSGGIPLTGPPTMLSGPPVSLTCGSGLALTNAEAAAAGMYPFSWP